METNRKYFVSQHFGKSLSTVELGSDRGTVSLALTRPEAHTLVFRFDMARLAQFAHGPAHHAEFATRVAIQQAHKLFAQHGAAAFEQGELPLALDTNPWIGDLTDAPYGGATAGYDTHVAASLVSAAAAGLAAPPPA